MVIQIMANSKYYYRAEIYFGDNGTAYGMKREEFKDCINELNHFIRSYSGNHVNKVGIFKRNVSDDKEIVTCRKNNR